MNRLRGGVVAVLLIVTTLCSSCFGGGSLEQGIDGENHIIYVGNTASITGNAGKPFNYALQAYLWYFDNHTAGYSDASGNKYSLKFVHYDDKGNENLAKNYTQKLVEVDKVFALVGHFGSKTVNSTLQYVKDSKIPVVYCASSCPCLYDTSRNIFPVQPLGAMEGRALLASAVAPENKNIGLACKKIGIVVADDTSGEAIGQAVVCQAENLGLIKNKDIFFCNIKGKNSQTALETLKNNNCDAVIIASDAKNFLTIAKQFVTSNYKNVKILSTSTNVTLSQMEKLEREGFFEGGREIYSNAWLTSGTTPSADKQWKDFLHFVEVLTLFDKQNNKQLVTGDHSNFGTLIRSYFASQPWAADGVSEHFLSSYAMAGFIAANVFCQGLSRLNGCELTREKYIEAMEKGVVDIAMGESISYANGQRKGVEVFALDKFDAQNVLVGGEVYRSLYSIEDIERATEESNLKTRKTDFIHKKQTQNEKTQNVKLISNNK